MQASTDAAASAATTQESALSIVTANITIGPRGHPVLHTVEIFGPEVAAGGLRATYKDTDRRKLGHPYRVRPKSKALQALGISWGISCPSNRIAEDLVGNPFAVPARNCLTKVRYANDAPTAAAVQEVKDCVHPYMKRKATSTHSAFNARAAQMVSANQLNGLKRQADTPSSGGRASKPRTEGKFSSSSRHFDLTHSAAAMQDVSQSQLPESFCSTAVIRERIEAGAALQKSIGRFIFAEGADFSTVDSPWFRSMIEAAAECGKRGLRPPLMHELRNPKFKPSPATHIVVPRRQSIGRTVLSAEVKVAEDAAAALAGGTAGVLNRGCAVTADGCDLDDIATYNVCIITSDDMIYYALENVGHIRTLHAVLSSSPHALTPSLPLPPPYCAESHNKDVMAKWVLDKLESEDFPFEIDDIVTIVLDGACRSWFPIIEAKYPHIVCQWCAAHSLNLLCQMIAELDGFDDLIADAKKVVTFMRNRTYARHLCRTHAGKIPTAWAASRFGTIFIVMERLSQMQHDLAGVVASAEFAAYTAAQQRDGRDLCNEVKGLINSDQFWAKIAKMNELVEPLFALLRRLDADHATVGCVYQRMLELNIHFREWEATKWNAISGHVAFKKGECTLVGAAGGRVSAVGKSVADMAYDRWCDMASDYRLKGGDTRSYGGGRLHSTAHCLNPFYLALEEWSKHRPPRPTIYLNRDAVRVELYEVLQKRIANEIKDAVKAKKELTTIKREYADFIAAAADPIRAHIFDGDTYGELQGHEWWEAEGYAWPTLRPHAIKILSQPSTSGTSERGFSAAKFARGRGTRPTQDVDTTSKLVRVRQHLRRVLEKTTAANLQSIWTIEGLENRSEAFDAAEDEKEARQIAADLSIPFPAAQAAAAAAAPSTAVVAAGSAAATAVAVAVVSSMEAVRGMA